MSKIPKEIDDLIWSVAETRNPDARLEFAKRYPTYLAELDRRARLVADLKNVGGRTNLSPEDAIAPKLALRNQTTSKKSIPWMNLAAGLAIFSLVGAASYFATLRLGQTTQAVSVVSQPQSESFSFPARAVTPLPQEAQTSNPNLEGAQTGTENVAPAGTQLAKKSSINLQSAYLTDALQMIGAIANVQVEVAPGMPNPLIVAKYDNMTAQEMLKDMSQQYAFAIFDQGDGKILIIPSEDSADSSSSVSISTENLTAGN